MITVNNYHAPFNIHSVYNNVANIIMALDLAHTIMDNYLQFINRNFQLECSLDNDALDI